MASNEISCPLCNPVLHEVHFDTNNFYLMASKSTSDILIIPKDHYTTMVDIPREMIQEFDELRRLVRKMLRVDFGGCIFYEHTGGGPAWSFVGHGDGHGHAHLHCAPVADGILKKLPDRCVNLEVNSWEELWATKKGDAGQEHYFYFEDDNERKFVILVAHDEEFLVEDIRR